MLDLLFLMEPFVSGDKRDKKHEQHLSLWRAVLATSMVSVYFMMFHEISTLLNARGKGLDYILSGLTVDFICCMVEKGFNSSCWKIWSNLFCLSKDMVMPWRFLLLVTSAQCRMTWWSWHQLPDYDLLSTFILHLQTIQLVTFPTKMNAVIQCRHYIGYGHP